MAWTFPRALRVWRRARAHAVRATVDAHARPVTSTTSSKGPDGLARPHVSSGQPYAARGAARVLTVSERTKHDLVELYAIPPERIVVTPNGVDPPAPRARVQATVCCKRRTPSR